ncbi:MAG: zinc ribbon domain-containing protein [Promethearchaeota archaeon]
MEQWYNIFSYFWWDTPVGIIASCIIIALAVYLTFYIVIELIELGYWIAVQSIKLTWIGMAILFYSLLFVFLILPLDAISPRKRLADTFNIFAKNMEHILYNFYPKLEKEIEKQKKHRKGNSSLLPYEAPALSPKARKIAKQSARNEELTGETQILSHPHKNTGAKIQYHCSKCGKPFTQMMNALLNTKKEAFCESCGLKYEKQNQIPSPIGN